MYQMLDLAYMRLMRDGAALFFTREYVTAEESLVQEGELGVNVNLQWGIQYTFGGGEEILPHFLRGK